jgi:uncharacterized RDD family membrane protein YckC
MNTEQMQYAGFWVRMGASIIDCSLIALLIFFLSISDYYAYLFHLRFASYLFAGFLMIVNGVFLVKWQATPGKMLLALKVVDARTGNALPFDRTVSRLTYSLVSIIPLGLGFIWVAFDSKKQGWHDKLAGTVVIRTHSGAPEPVRFEQPPAA